ncbi:MAG: NYN domain-containing protein [Anaerolineae bacterium]
MSTALDEVALFLDFDNVRYGYLNTYRQEPDLQDLMTKARQYGRVVVAVAYADFTQHPPHYRQGLEVAGITPRDIPQRGGRKHASSSEMVMLMDIIDCLLDRPSVQTYVLMTGDSDFVRVVARARHRFGKQVIISGVPGTISQDLIASADEADLLIPEGVELSDEGGLPSALRAVSDAEVGLLRLVAFLEKNRPYLTLNFIHSYAVSPTGRLRLSDAEANRILDVFIEDGLLIPFEKRLDDGRVVVNVRLNRDHHLARQILDNRPVSLVAAEERAIRE